MGGAQVGVGVARVGVAQVGVVVARVVVAQVGVVVARVGDRGGGGELQARSCLVAWGQN